jgi:hypothetical protein
MGGSNWKVKVGNWKIGFARAFILEVVIEMLKLEVETGALEIGSVLEAGRWTLEVERLILELQIERRTLECVHECEFTMKLEVGN